MNTLPHSNTSVEIARAFKTICTTLSVAIPLESGVDPAPWFSPFPVGGSGDLDDNLWAKGAPSENSPNYNWQQKIIERTHFCLHSALLTGDLTAHFLIGSSRHNIPGWAWQRLSHFRQCLARNRLPLSPLLPDEWQEWTHAQVCVDTDALHEWLTKLDTVSVERAPDLPMPHDQSDEPSAIYERRPALGPDVPLTEAATWVTYYVAMNFNGLCHIIDDNEIESITEPRFPSLDAGLLTLIDAGRGSKPAIEFFGRYEKRLAERSTGVPLQRIEALQLADYCQPIWPHNALQWAPRSRIARTNAQVFEIDFFGRTDGFYDVRVDRDQLLAAFPPREADALGNRPSDKFPLKKIVAGHKIRAPSVKAGRPPSDKMILAKADEMKARGLDGRTIAKEMRFETGFANVATTSVRALIKGRWKPEGRPKIKGA